MAVFSTQIGDAHVSSVGEILVEIMSLDIGKGFQECQKLRGPYASGAPAIFIDQVAKLGVSASLVGSVGNDDFGQYTVNRLKNDGVDVSAIEIIHDKPTGIAFVRYQIDGERDFLFTLQNSAATQINVARMREHLIKTTHLHVVGSSLSMAPVAECIASAIAQVKSNGGTISFDPNVRPEIMQEAGMQDRLMDVLHQCDIFLPSAGEIALFSAKTDEREAVKDILDIGFSEIVIKKGSTGAV